MWGCGYAEDMTSTPQPALLDNPRSERVRKVAALTGRSARARFRLMAVEGPQAVRELVAFRGATVRDVYITEAAADAHPDIVSAARAVTRWVHPATEDVVHAMSPDAQGVLAVADFGAVEVPERGDVVPAGGFAAVLARVQDPGNVGTLIRTADAMGASCVVVTTGSAEVTSPKVVRSSAGSVFHLPVLSGIGLGEAVDVIHGAGAQVLGTSGGSGSLDLTALIEQRGGGAVLGAPHAWVLGNEARGMSTEEMAMCDHLVKVPLHGHAESLNVSQAGAMCMFASMAVLGRKAQGR